MPNFKKKISYFGGKPVVEFRGPTNEEMNAYTAEVMEAKGSVETLKARARFFDKLAVNVEGAEKADIPDAVKANAVFQIFAVVEVVDEKN